jgi:hypothetical protein
VQRLFFDVLGAASSSYDYHGHAVKNSDEARDRAELIAMDLGHSETEDWAGFEVRVRDASGATLFSVPVRTPPGQLVA